MPACQRSAAVPPGKSTLVFFLHFFRQRKFLPEENIMDLSSLLSADSQQKQSPLAGIMQSQSVSRVGSQGGSFSSHIVAASQRGDTVTISEEGRALAAAMLNEKNRAATSSALADTSAAPEEAAASPSLADEYRAALGINEEGDFEVNRAGDVDDEALEAMQKELESLLQQMAELSAQAQQNPEAKQAVAQIKQLISELQKQMKSGGATAA